ncbi:MAG TPA: DUF4173 domain-containing protein [Candidatus Dormibacteraeota bacterium]|nr:DUF4173 domain-containing protein [Candidatus Dormibacteraeota bacterium]
MRANATWLSLAAAVVVGLTADQALRVGTFGLAASLAITFAGLALVFASRLLTPESRVLVAAAVLFGAWLTVRSSPWLLWPDLVMSFALLGLAASAAVRGSLLDTGVAEAVARGVQALAHGVAGGAFVLKPAVGARQRLAAIAPLARGLLIAIPIGALLAGLLATADPVFASFFNLNFDFGQLTMDAIFVVGGSLAAAGLLRLAAAQPLSRVDGPMWRLGSIEGLVVLAVLDAIFAGFAVAQLMAAAGAAGNALRAAGITYADYARSGFFQLLWVAGITAVVLIVFSRITGFNDRSSRRAFLVLGEIAVVLTLLIVFVAFQRLSLYESAYGFTMLRLYSQIFAVWIALVFVLLAADIGGFFRRRRWFVGATSISAMIVLLALNLANPEAVVVALNLNLARSMLKIDAQYLGELSSDATPALLDQRSRVDQALGREISRVACAGPRSYSVSPGAFNWSAAAAAAARRERC